MQRILFPQQPVFLFRLLALLIVFCLSFSIQAQDIGVGYPKGYFQYPIYPGKSNTLAGVLGDLRTNHFHGGIDVRTGGVEGLPVTASADGYVSKVAVQRGGYGNVIFLKHPNGYTTVYGHLKSFGGAIGTYVREQQYQQQTFEIDLNLEPGQIPVKKGEYIGASGNTGGSQGPHLHFEIRDSVNNHLNPLFFGFQEVKDNTPPKFVSVGLVPMDINSRVQQQFERKTYSAILPKGSNVYTLPNTVPVSGRLGLELQAFDRMDGTGFNYGLSCIEVWMDGAEIFSYNMESFPAIAARDYNYLINYEARVTEGTRYYKCYNPEGNTFNLYQTDKNRGYLMVNDTLEHEVMIKVFDSFQNVSILKMTIKGETIAPATLTNDSATQPLAIRTRVDKNIVKIMAHGYQSQTPALLYAKGKTFEIPVSYIVNGTSYYLWDLEKGLADSVQIGTVREPLYFKAKVAPGVSSEYTVGNVRIKFNENTLFEPFYLRLKEDSLGFEINKVEEPLRGAIDITYQTDKDFPKSQIIRDANGHKLFISSLKEGSAYQFSTRELGRFAVAADTLLPSIRWAEHSSKRLKAYIVDRESGIQTFNAFVNGQWILMNYEYKENLIWSEKLDESIPFEGEIMLEVTDRAGNKAVSLVEVKEPVVKKPTPKKVPVRRR